MAKDHPKIVLIQVSGRFDNYWQYYPPIGITSVASYSIKWNKIPKNNFLILDSNIPQFFNILKSFNPDIIGFSSFSNNYSSTITIAKKIKKIFPNSLYIIGGVHISLFPQTLNDCFDIAILKEGEETFSQLLNKWNQYKKSKSINCFSKIKGIAFKHKNELIINPDQGLIEPLDRIPPCDWSIVPRIFFRKELIKNNSKQEWKDHLVYPLFTSRGCPFHCVFCARSSLWKKVRFFSEERVVQEIENLYKTYGVTAIQIWDDLFVFSSERLNKIKDLLKARNLLGKIIFYRVFARSDLFTPEIAKILKQLNISSVAFGLESGSQKILSYLKNNTTTVTKNYEAVDICEKYNIGFVACMMLGSPSETKLDMDKTYRFTKFIYRKKTLEIIDLARATPFPGTELYQYALEKKLLPKNYDLKSTYLSLNDFKNSKPLLIKNQKTINAYKYYWKKIKNFEKNLNERNQEQKGYKISKIKLNLYNQFNNTFFLPRYLLKLIFHHRYKEAIKLNKELIISYLTSS